MVMLGGCAGALTLRSKWMATARLWRILLLQREEGCWDLTDSLAFALEAHEGAPPPKEHKENKGLAALATLFVGDGDLDDQLDDAADDVMESSDEEDDDGAEHNDATTKRIKDCPLSFSSIAIARCMPQSLLDLGDDNHLHRGLSRRMTCRRTATADINDEQAAGAGVTAAEHVELPSVANIERIWATLCVVNALEASAVCWMPDDEADPERTIVDSAREWLDAQAEADERVGKLLRSGELAAAAKKASKTWKRIMEYNISVLRRAEVVDKFSMLTHIQRASGQIMKSIKTDHGCVHRALRGRPCCSHLCLTQSYASGNEHRSLSAETYAPVGIASMPTGVAQDLRDAARSGRLYHALAALHDPHHAGAFYPSCIHLVRCRLCDGRRTKLFNMSAIVEHTPASTFRAHRSSLPPGSITRAALIAARSCG
jgi:hypothetical protein